MIKKFISDFKEFALKGNALNLAIGVIIGGAFQAIISSLVKEVITPLIGIFARTDFQNLHWEIFGSKINYGTFLSAVINFLITALLIFCMVRFMNKLYRIGKKNCEQEETEKKCPYCLEVIAIKATRCSHCTSEQPSDEEE